MLCVWTQGQVCLNHWNILCAGQGECARAVHSGRRVHLDSSFSLSIEVQYPTNRVQHSLGHLLVSAYEAAAETESPVAALVIPLEDFTAGPSSSGVSLLAQITLANSSPVRVRWEVADASTCQLDESRSVCQTAAVIWQVETDAGPSIANLSLVETAVKIQANDGWQLANTGLFTALSVTDMLGKQFITSVESMPPTRPCVQLAVLSLLIRTSQCLLRMIPVHGFVRLLSCTGSSLYWCCSRILVCDSKLDMHSDVVLIDPQDPDNPCT